MAVAHRGLFCKVISFCVVVASCSATVANGVGQPDHGQALALNKREWQRWLDFILAKHSCRLHVLVWLTGAFALRCTEAIVHDTDIYIYIYLYIYIYINIFIYMYTTKYVLVQTQGISCCGDKPNNQIVQRNILVSKRD